MTLKDVVVVTTNRYGDDRGFFCETWNAPRLAKEYNIDVAFLQDNMSYSKHVGTVRGLHYQAPPHAQAKLVRVGRGRILDVAVDFREGSDTFGKWVSVELSAENGTQLFVPAGFLHGFVTLEPDTEVMYKCSDVYAPTCEGSIRFDDPDLAIDWGIDNSKAVLSDKDAVAPFMRDVQTPFSYGDF